MTKSVILTPAQIDRLKTGALSDREVPGLSIVASAPDRKRWRFKRVIAGTKTTVELILGSYPDYSIDEAREWAAPLSKAVSRGDDPRSVNAVEAWLSSLPGHVYANVRQPLVHSLNLAHLMPLSALWAGPEGNRHLGGPPLLMAETGGSRARASRRRTR